MFKCYDHLKLKNEVLKCDQCSMLFNEYDHPKFLPCHETICSNCAIKIEKEAINKKFKCNICLEDHYISNNGFKLNKTKFDLIKSEPIEISRGYEYERLQENLKKVETIANLLWFESENGIDIIKEHCNELIRFIQLSTEEKIEQINKLSDELILFIKDYEGKCTQSFLTRNESIKKSINKLINDSNIFLKEKQAYLQQFKINDEEIKVFNKMSEELQSALKIESINLNSLLFCNELIKFQSNTKEISKFELGNFDSSFINSSVFNIF